MYQSSKKELKYKLIKREETPERLNKWTHAQDKGRKKKVKLSP
jgi:hypothetical protein